MEMRLSGAFFGLRATRLIGASPWTSVSKGAAELPLGVVHDK